MNKIMREFLRRGIAFCGLGPVVLAVLYLILQYNGEVKSLTVNEVCIGIFSLTALAFLAGGMNVIYQIERLPLMAAILIHGCVLYVGYLATYLVNDWLEWGTSPILIFTTIFIMGYLLIWAAVYAIIKRNTAKVNECLKKQQKHTKESDMYSR